MRHRRLLYNGLSFLMPYLNPFGGWMSPLQMGNASCCPDENVLTEDMQDTAAIEAIEYHPRVFEQNLDTREEVGDVAMSRREGLPATGHVEVSAPITKIHAKMKHSKKRDEEEWGSFDERQRAFDEERNRIRNNYNMESVKIRDDLVANLARTEEQLRNADMILEEILRADDEERERKFEEIRQQRKAQAEMLERRRYFSLMAQKAEAEWTERLAGLKNVHEPIHAHFTALAAFVRNQVASRIMDVCVDNALDELKILKHALLLEIATMSDEVVDMQELRAEHPQAYFLFDIEESAESVAAAACNLLQIIGKVEFELNSIERTVSEALLKDCSSSFNKLEKAVSTIPNVIDLRRKYQQ